MYFELKNISVHYDKVQALENVTLHVEQREIVALIGANGAGKTSTLRAITALARPSSGEIWFGGKRIDRLEPAAVVALGISMVPEGRHVYPFMSVKDNLLMGAVGLKTGRRPGAGKSADLINEDHIGNLYLGG